jgi:DNA-directed RNA polymerase subunit RPC12/RpoP
MGLKCPYCSHLNEIDDAGGFEAVEELSFHTTIAEMQSAAPKVEAPMVKCSSCAAEIVKPANVTSLTCPFCASNIVAVGSTATVILPNAVLPFGVPRDKAIDSFRAWLKSRWFAPNALKREGRLDAAMNGAYVPAWTYDTHATTRYEGQRGDAYYVTVGSGKNRQRVRKVRWSYRSGVVENTFDDVLVLASRSLPAKQMHALEPWDLKSVVPFSTDYLAGFRAECYTIDLAEGFELAKDIMRARIEGSIRNDIGGDEQRINKMYSQYDRLTFKHLLLPVWVSAYRYQNKVYQFLVNARTGEVQGERPYSWIKITLFTIMCLIIAAIVFAIVMAVNK